MQLLQIDWENLREFEVFKGVFGKFYHMEKMSVVQWRFDKEAELPLHDHIHEQLTVIQSGKLKLQVGDNEIVLNTNDVLPINSMVKHGGIALEKTVAYDIFSPVREDFKEKFSS